MGSTNWDMKCSPGAIPGILGLLFPRAMVRFGCSGAPISENRYCKDRAAGLPPWHCSIPIARARESTMSQGAEHSSGADSGEVDPKLLALLRCPCPQHQPLQQRPDGLACSGCERVFPVVDGIPVILPEPEDPSAD